MEETTSTERTEGSSFSTRLIILAVLVLISAAIWAYTVMIKPGFTSRQFVGNVVSKTDDSVLLSGFYVLENADQSENPQPTMAVRIIKGSNTKVTKTIVTLPTAEQLEASGGIFNGDDLPRQKIDGNLGELNEDDYVVVWSDSNIWGKNEVEAREIEYTITSN